MRCEVVRNWLLSFDAGPSLRGSSGRIRMGSRWKLIILRVRQEDTYKKSFFLRPTFFFFWIGQGFGYKHAFSLTHFSRYNPLFFSLTLAVNIQFLVSAGTMASHLDNTLVLKFLHFQIVTYLFYLESQVRRSFRRSGHRSNVGSLSLDVL